MTTFNNQDLQSKFDDNGYIAINPLFSIDKIEEIKIELSRYIKEVTPNVPDHHIFYENKDDECYEFIKEEVECENFEVLSKKGDIIEG